jgi:hypothetical protein
MSSGPTFDAYTWGHPGQVGGMMPGLGQQQLPQLGAAFFGNGTSIVDKIPRDMLYMVDPHWNQFPPLNPLM